MGELDRFILTNRDPKIQLAGFPDLKTTNPVLFCGLSRTGKEIDAIRERGAMGPILAIDGSLLPTPEDFKQGFYHITDTKLPNKQPAHMIRKARRGTYSFDCPIDNTTSPTMRHFYEVLQYSGKYLNPDDPRYLSMLDLAKKGTSPFSSKETTSLYKEMLSEVSNRSGAYRFENALKVLEFSQARKFQEDRADQIGRLGITVDTTPCPPINLPPNTVRGVYDIHGPTDFFTRNGMDEELRGYKFELFRVVQPGGSVFIKSQIPIGSDALPGFRKTSPSSSPWHTFISEKS